MNTQEKIGMSLVILSVVAAFVILLVSGLWEIAIILGLTTTCMLGMGLMTIN